MAPACSRTCSRRLLRCRWHSIAPCGVQVFGAMMNVELTNDGPVTLILDSKDKTGKNSLALGDESGEAAEGDAAGAGAGESSKPSKAERRAARKKQKNEAATLAASESTRSLATDGGSADAGAGELPSTPPPTGRTRRPKLKTRQSADAGAGGQPSREEADRAARTASGSAEAALGADPS